MRARRCLIALVVAGALGAGALFTAAGCGSSSGAAPSSSTTPPPGSDGAPPLPDAAVPACVTNPQTYLDIINACTDAQVIDKTVALSAMSLPDGGLRPLP